MCVVVVECTVAAAVRYVVVIMNGDVNGMQWYDIDRLLLIDVQRSTHNMSSSTFLCVDYVLVIQFIRDTIAS